MKTLRQRIQNKKINKLVKRENKKRKKEAKRIKKALKKEAKLQRAGALRRVKRKLTDWAKWLVNILMYVILLPFHIVYSFFRGILKRLRFSIAFKISASYFLLYIVIMLIVTITTSIGYFIYSLNGFKDETMMQDRAYLEENLSDRRKLEEFLDSGDAVRISIYDENLNIVYSSDGSNVRYSDNIIVVLENLVNLKQFVYSARISSEGQIYYINVFYSVMRLIEESLSISAVIFVSGAIGLFLLVPIVSRTSYKVIRPIKNMTEITRTISVNNINTRLDLKDTQDELKELSQTFNEMMDRIEEGYKSQQQFVSDASHELRTPIAVIKGYVDMLDRWGKNDKAILDESIEAIKNETDSMQDLIEKLLFIARSDKHTLTFTKEDFNICDVLSEIEKETIMIDSKHKFAFRFYEDANIYADRNRIKQAIRIFIENAIKFTPENGSISLDGFIDDDFYVVRISDTGIGVAPNDLNKIFDRLYRAEESRNRDIGGHGLGLSIAKIIVLGHKGKIKVKSIPNKGSQFSVMLPYLMSQSRTNDASRVIRQ